MKSSAMSITDGECTSLTGPGVAPSSLHGAAGGVNAGWASAWRPDAVILTGLRAGQVPPEARQLAPGNVTSLVGLTCCHCGSRWTTVRSGSRVGMKGSGVDKQLPEAWTRGDPPDGER